MPLSKAEVLQGTLDLLVLKTLDSMGPMHGFGSPCASAGLEDLLQLNQERSIPPAAPRTTRLDCVQMGRFGK